MKITQEFLSIYIIYIYIYFWRATLKACPQEVTSSNMLRRDQWTSMTFSHLGALVVQSDQVSG